MPARFDLDRRPEDHFAFGFGRHFCVGAHLARLEARTAVQRRCSTACRICASRPTPTRGIVGLAFRSPTALPVVF